MKDSDAVRKAKDAVILTQLKEGDPDRFATCEAYMSTIHHDNGLCAHSLVTIWHLKSMSNMMGLHGSGISCEEMNNDMVKKMLEGGKKPTSNVAGLMEDLKKIL